MTQAASFDCIPTVPKLQTKRILCSVCNYPGPSDAVPLLIFRWSGKPLHNAGVPSGASIELHSNLALEGGLGLPDSDHLTYKAGFCQLQLCPAPAVHTSARPGLLHCMLWMIQGSLCYWCCLEKGLAPPADHASDYGRTQLYTGFPGSSEWDTTGILAALMRGDSSSSPSPTLFPSNGMY